MRSTHPGPETGNNSIEIWRGDTPFVSNWLDLQIDNFHIVKPLGPADPMLTSLNQPPLIFTFFRRWEGSRWSPPPCLRATRAPGPSSCGSSCSSSSRTSPASSSSPGPGTAGSSNSRTRTRWSSVYISIYNTLPLWIRMNILAQQIRECAI